MYRRLALLLLLALVPLISQTTPGQEIQRHSNSAPAPSPSPTIDPAVEKKALDLLESISDQSAKFNSAANRIRASAAIADLLWRRDENRARALFKGAITQLATHIAETDFGDVERYQEISRFHELRQNLVMRIAAHDPELALTALRQTRLPGTVTHQWLPQQESNLELTLANFIVAKNPELALKIARASLSRGVTWNLTSLLSQLAQKDVKSAQGFYGEIVARLKSEDLGKNSDPANYALHLLSSFQPPQADEQTFRDLFTMVLSSLFSLNRETQSGINMAQNFYHQLDGLMPLVEKYAASRTTDLRTWMRTVERTLDPGMQMYKELSRLSQTASLDDILALAEKQPSEFKTMAYQHAAGKALTSGDVTRAKEIIEMIPDLFQRRQMLDQLEAHNARNLKGDDQLTSARALIEKARTVTRKVELIAQIANSLAANNKKTEALELLNDGKILVTATPSSAEQVKAQLRLAQAYAALDPDQAFAIVQPLIIRLNELLAAAAVLDGIDFRYLKDGEWEMPGVNNLGMIVSRLNQILTVLGRIDFDRALSFVAQIDRPEIRIMIQIDIAQVVLTGGSADQRFNGPTMLRSHIMN
ncbi:MAG TPA: hypothetical protein VFX97_17795 [Pyrinomonadaceae bacterium]|nr:hypothetical protein [Pyrinomonadaceae bacterium]